jgi:hypothetical protein
VSQILLRRAEPPVRASRSDIACARRIAIGSLGGDPDAVRLMASRQNCRRIRPIVWLVVVSGRRERVLFRARRAM